MKLSRIVAVCLLVAIAAFASCSKAEEYSLEELEARGAEGLDVILAKTVSKPWQGEDFVPGKLGGTWNAVVSEDPKSFNLLVAEEDSATAAVVNSMHDYLFDYDVVRREWKPRLASPEVVVDEQAGTLSVVCTLRDDLYWSYYNTDKKIKVTSDDVLFWYNDVRGDRECRSSGYYQQFLTMPDGTEAHIDMEKIDERRFAFRFPCIVAEPILTCNMEFGPRHLYEPAKAKGGAQGLRDIFNVSVDPRTIPSMGEWFLVKYSPGQRLVYKRNPDYWRTDTTGVSIPYIEEYIVRIIPDENTHLLLFKEGKTESYTLRPEDLDELVLRQGQQERKGAAALFKKRNLDYTVFNAEGALGAAFWTFNQNPKNKDTPQYEWFTQKEFRQAMSCLLNRERIIAQVYRGLAEPKYSFFPEPNAYYNPAIALQYRYSREQAAALLASIGIVLDSQGVMRDRQNRAIEFDLTIRSESTVYNDIASIIRDELSQTGIKANIRILDFQKQVELLFKTFEWDSMLMGLSGSNIFPSQGSNVWPSSGNLHMWNPNQEQPATEWEARVDYLYNLGHYTIDPQKGQALWDEFQSIMLEQCPVISLLRPRSFFALSDRWDFANFYYDNRNGAETSFISLR